MFSIICLLLHPKKYWRERRICAPASITTTMPYTRLKCNGHFTITCRVHGMDIRLTATSTPVLYFFVLVLVPYRSMKRGEENFCGIENVDANSKILRHPWKNDRNYFAANKHSINTDQEFINISDITSWIVHYQGIPRNCKMRKNEKRWCKLANNQYSKVYDKLWFVCVTMSF